MLDRDQLKFLDDQFASFKDKNNENQNVLHRFLEQHRQLLEDYKELRVKQELMGAELKLEDTAREYRKPYDLVIVDGNGYLFNDDFVKDQESGGRRAARALQETVAKFLREKFDDHNENDIFIRIYADLITLSTVLGREKLVGVHKRSFSTFAALFTRTLGTCDFADTLDEEGTLFKVQETFKHAVKDSSCRHILFAACHDRAYLPLVHSYRDQAHKFTLVRHVGQDLGFCNRGLASTKFPEIFRASIRPPAANLKEYKGKVPDGRDTAILHKSLPATENSEPWRSPTAKAVFTLGDTNGASLEERSDARLSFGTKRPCLFYQNGNCRNGDSCGYLHDPEAPKRPSISGLSHGDVAATRGISPQSPREAASKVREDWRSKPAEGLPPANRGASLSIKRHGDQGTKALGKVDGLLMPCPFHLKGLCRQGDSCVFDHEPASSSQVVPNPSSMNRVGISLQLPSSDQVPEQNIALNRFGARLDTFHPAPSQADWDEYSAQLAVQKPCNNILVFGSCNNVACEYSHEPLADGARRAHIWILKTRPCSWGAQCRKAECPNGHVCQQEGCVGQLKSCKMTAAMHDVDPVMTEVVRAKENMMDEDLSPQETL